MTDKPGDRGREAGSELARARNLLSATAIRALANPSPADIRARIEEVVGEKVNDGQLDQCALTLHDLDEIKQAFSRVLTLGVYHSRIEYPPLPAATGAVAEDHDPHRSIRSLSGLADRSS